VTDEKDAFFAFRHLSQFCGAKLRKKNDMCKKKLKKKSQTAFFSHFICIFQKKAVPLQPKTKIESYAKDI